MLIEIPFRIWYDLNIKIKIGNATKTLTEWCEIFELDYKKINARYNRNEDISLFDLFN